jgi:hypothetical protein
LDPPPPGVFLERPKQARVDRDGYLLLFAWIEMDSIPPDKA